MEYTETEYSWTNDATSEDLKEIPDDYFKQLIQCATEKKGKGGKGGTQAWKKGTRKTSGYCPMNLRKW